MDNGGFTASTMEHLPHTGGKTSTKSMPLSCSSKLSADSFQARLNQLELEPSRGNPGALGPPIQLSLPFWEHVENGLTRSVTLTNTG